MKVSCLNISRKTLSIALTTILTFSAQSVFSMSKKDVENYQGKSPKYIFLFIGDGMSFPQISSMGVYRATINKKFDGTKDHPSLKNPPKTENPSFSEFPILGAALTYDASKFVTDSAAAATAIATGNKTLDGRLGVDAFDKKVLSIAELLKAKKNYKVGIVTSVSLDHATPAGFYAHQVSRSSYYDIAQDLVNSQFNYFGGGGFKKPTGQKDDQQHIYDVAKQHGYTVVTNKEAIQALKSGDDKVIAVNSVFDNPADVALRFSIDREDNDLTLADYTQKGVELLENSKDGFFMMIEGGKIDWAAHANDALTMIKDVEELEKAVDVAERFYEQHPDETLIIVTGDHETGGISIGFSGTEYDTFFKMLDKQTVSYQVYENKIQEYRDNKTPFDIVLTDLEPYYGLLMPNSPNAAKHPEMVLNQKDISKIKEAWLQSMVPLSARDRDINYRIDYSYGNHEPLQTTVTHILNNRAGIGWTTTAHSGLPAAVFAKGVGQELFSGTYENTGIFDRIKAVSKIK